MKIVRSLDGVTRDTDSVVTVGSFDGVHLAHRKIITEVRRHAASRGGRSVVMTFEPHPSEVVSGGRDRVELLTTLEERIALIAELDIDLLFVIDFTPEFAKLSSEEFYRKYVVNGVGVSEVVVGYDHMFGRNREAGVRELMRLGGMLGFQVYSTPPVTVDGLVVNSTVIRSLLQQGNVDRARILLGTPYALKGMVVKGDGRGKSLGFPTANIDPLSSRKLIPANGVYLVGVEFEGKHHYGMMNIGVRPTLGDGGGQTMEVHIFDLARDLYGSEVTIMFHRKLRDERKFGSVEDLRTQLGKDKEISLAQLGKLKSESS